MTFTFSYLSNMASTGLFVFLFSYLHLFLHFFLHISSLHSAEDTFILHKQGVNNMNQTHLVTQPSSLSAVFRCQDGSGSGSGNVPLDQKFLLKWSVPLSFVEALEFGSSEDMAENSHYPTPHSGEKVVINAKPSMNHTHSVILNQQSAHLSVPVSLTL